MVNDAVCGFMYASEADVGRNETVCKIMSRAPMTDEGWGIEACFRVRFADGYERDVLSQQLSPWYPT